MSPYCYQINYYLFERNIWIPSSRRARTQPIVGIDYESVGLNKDGDLEYQLDGFIAQLRLRIPSDGRFPISDQSQ